MREEKKNKLNRAYLNTKSSFKFLYTKKGEPCMHSLDYALRLYRGERL